MRRYLLFLAAIVGSINSASAQCTPLLDIDRYHQYDLQVCSMASTPVTLTNVTTPTFTSNDNGVNVNQIFLPFPIQVYGVDWDLIHLNTNGALFFGSIGSTLGSAVLPLSLRDAESLPVIAAAWSDLLMADNSQIVYSTQGTAGDRQFIVRYNNMRYYATGTNNNALASFDIVFYENPARQGDVEIRYYRWDMASQARSVWPAMTVGMQSWDDGTSYFSLYDGEPNVDHAAFASQYVGKQLSLRYVGEDSFNTACGSMGYNLTSLRGTDISYTADNGDRYIVNVCGEIQDPVCANNPATEKAMICRVPAGNNPTPVDLGVFGPGGIKYELPMGDAPGLHMILQSGSYCEALEASVFVRLMFFCVPTQTTPMIVAVAQAPPPCVFYMTVLTDKACSGAIRDNSTIYRASTMPGCTTVNDNAVSTSGYQGNTCPRGGHNLEPLVQTNPTQVVIGSSGYGLLTGVQQVTLPFPFTFYGTNYTTVNVSTKGALLFGSAAYDGKFNGKFPDLGVPAAGQSAFPAIIGFGGDLLGQSSAGVDYPTIKYSIEGVTPQRQFVVRYSNMKFANTMGLMDSPITFDIVLTEASGIDIKYYIVSPSNNNYSIGLRGASSNQYTAHTDDVQLTSGVAFRLQGTTLSYSPQPAGSGPSDESSSSSISDGAIAGAVVGSVVGAAILAAVAFILCSKVSGKSSTSYSKETDTEMTGV